MNSLGFTGTRKGITDAQRERLTVFLRANVPYEVHHGDCIGADNVFASIVWRQFWNTFLISHPPIEDALRAYTEANKVLEPKPYLERDRDIVDASDHLLACPKESQEPISSKGSGTWYTVRYARSLRRPVTIIWPDGSTT